MPGFSTGKSGSDNFNSVLNKSHDETFIPTEQNHIDFRLRSIYRITSTLIIIEKPDFYLRT